MDVFLIRALQVILSLSILVLLHEAGHFFAAKLFKIRVEKFALFFDPWFRLFKFKPKNSFTQYVLGWLPLGGYVKISGMVDESMDKKQLQGPVQPWEFRAKPAWQRLIVMLAGVVVNFFLALFIYSMILFAWGETYVPMNQIEQGFKFNEQAQQLGFKDKDIPLSTDKVRFKKFDDLQSISTLYRGLSTAKFCIVERDGKKVKINLPGNLDMLGMMNNIPPFLNIYMPSVIDKIDEHSPIYNSNIKPGDQIIGINGKQITTWNEFTEEKLRIDDILMQKNKSDSIRLQKVSLVVLKQNGQIDTIRTSFNHDFKLGVMWHSPMMDYKTVKKSYSLLESFPAGAKYGWNVLSGYIHDLKYLFTAKGAKSIGSFGTIGALFPPHWDWFRFWNLTAFISLMLAFMNILPIPALDGGHAFFLLYEVITGRKPSEKFMEKAELFGIIILLLLMTYAIFNDVMRFIF